MKSSSLDPNGNNTLWPHDVVESNPRSAASKSPSPEWQKTFQAALGKGVGGFAYAVLRDGTLVETGSWGYAQMPSDAVPDGIAWSPATLCNLASVSKTITATAVLLMVQKHLISSVNDLLLPYLTDLFPGLQPASGVETVTLAELLTMTARLPVCGTLNAAQGPQAFVRDYLTQQALIPHQLSEYSNTNFTILQVLIDALCARHRAVLGVDGYVEFVQTHVLQPMGISPKEIKATPLAPEAATLAYNAAHPRTQGHYWPAFNCVGPGGWIGSAEAVARYAAGLRAGKVLHAKYVDFMMRQMLGWYPGGTSYGLAYHHNGGLSWPDSTGGTCQISTGVVDLPDGYDVALLVNKAVPRGIIALMLQAFDGGMPVAS